MDKKFKNVVLKPDHNKPPEDESKDGFPTFEDMKLWQSSCSYWSTDTNDCAKDYGCSCRRSDDYGKYI